MSRHRNVRRLDYAEEYDGYDEVLGRSVEDDFCISPSSAQFLYDRNARQQHVAEFLSDDDIPEEGETEGDDSAQDKYRVGRQDSLDYVRPDLNPIDEARLRSCLDEIHNIVGDSIPEHVLITSIMENGFDLERSLDQILSGATTSAPPGAGAAAPKSRRERMNAKVEVSDGRAPRHDFRPALERGGVHGRFSRQTDAGNAQAVGGGGRGVSSLVTASIRCQTVPSLSSLAKKCPSSGARGTAEAGDSEPPDYRSCSFPTKGPTKMIDPSQNNLQAGGPAAPLFSELTQSNRPLFGKTISLHKVPNTLEITPASRLASQRGDQVPTAELPSLSQLASKHDNTTTSSLNVSQLACRHGKPDTTTGLSSFSQLVNEHGNRATNPSQTSTLSQLVSQHGNSTAAASLSSLSQLAGRQSIPGGPPLFRLQNVSEGATDFATSNRHSDSVLPTSKSLFGTSSMSPRPLKMAQGHDSGRPTVGANVSGELTTGSEVYATSPLSRLAQLHLNRTQGTLFRGNLSGSAVHPAAPLRLTVAPARAADSKPNPSLAIIEKPSAIAKDVEDGESGRDSPVFDLTAALRSSARADDPSNLKTGDAGEPRTMDPLRSPDEENSILEWSVETCRELLRAHQLLLANEFVSQMLAPPSWFARTLCLRCRVRVLATPINSRPVSPFIDNVGDTKRRVIRFTFVAPSPDAIVLAAQARPFGARSEGTGRNAVAPTLPTNNFVKVDDVSSVAEGITKLRLPPSKPVTARLSPEEAASEAELPKSSRVSPDITVADKIGNVSTLDLDNSSNKEQSARSTPSRVPREPKVDARREYERERGGGKDLLNLVVIGHVDAGKSTLMGHLLCLMGAISQKTMHKHEQEAKKIGKASFMYAWVLDETGEERSRGVTMDVGYSRFETPRKVVTLLDAPGHRDFIPNMITGASQADVAMLVVDATRGEFETGFETGGQTREHALLVRSLGVSQMILAVNKLDTVGWSQERYQHIVKTLSQFLKQAGFKEADLSYIPCSGLTGENLTQAPKDESFRQWYSGPSLLEQIDQFQAPERPVTKPFRLCVSDVFRGQGSAFSVAGKVETGMVSAGDRMLVAPLGELCTIKSIAVDESSVTVAFAGDQVVLAVTGIDQANVTVGCVICDPAQPISVASRFRARIVVFNIDMPITKGFQAVLHYQSLCEPIIIKRLISQLHKNTGEALKKRPRCLTKQSNAVVELEVSRPICIEVYKDIKELGRFMLRSGGSTVAAGLVTEIL